MYSIKPGRGPSLMGVFGGLMAAFFGVVWTVSALQMGAPGPFALFGVGFVIMALAGAAYNAYNVISRDRMSHLDITSDEDESDPVSRAFGHDRPGSGLTRREMFSRARSRKSRPAAPRQPVRPPEGKLCPYCAAPVEKTHQYCPRCGADQ